MPYAVAKKDGRYVVTSPAGKTWKTTYPSRAGAEKGVSYVESRFGGASPAASPSSSSIVDSPDTAEERKALGIAPKKARPDPEAF